MSGEVEGSDFYIRDGYMEQLDAQKEVEMRIHGLKVRIGKARAAAKRADTLEQKFALYERAKALARERDLLQRNY